MQPLLLCTIYLMNSNTISPKRKPGPKGKVLEPYADTVLSMWREAKTLREIQEWLKESPRLVDISQQAIHQWVNLRIAKLKARAAEFGSDSTWPTTAPAPVADPQAPSLAPTAVAQESARPPSQAAIPRTRKPDNKPAPWDLKQSKSSVIGKLSLADEDILDAGNPFGKK